MMIRLAFRVWQNRLPSRSLIVQDAHCEPPAPSPGSLHGKVGAFGVVRNVAGRTERAGGGPGGYVDKLAPNVSKHDPGDHLHELATDEDGKLELSCQFDYDEVDRNLFGVEPEDSVTFGDMSAALSLVLGWICGDARRTTEVKIVASRALALHWLLSPENSQYDSMSDIARVCQVTKAAVSKALLSLKDQTGCAINAGKGHFTRATFANAQLDAVAGGTHSSVARRDKRA